MSQRMNHPRVNEIERIAKLLTETWARCEPEHGVTKHPVSYVATFVDMAKAVVEDAEPIHNLLDNANVFRSESEDEPYRVRLLTLAERITALIADRDEARKLSADTAHALANASQLLDNEERCWDDLAKLQHELSTCKEELANERLVAREGGQVDG